jgi:hypothetical protein
MGMGNDTDDIVSMMSLSFTRNITIRIKIT